jgi:PAS domain S-box-containing protein
MGHSLLLAWAGQVCRWRQHGAANTWSGLDGSGPEEMRATWRNGLLTLAILALLGAAGYLAFDLYHAGQQEVVSQFNALHSLLARQAAHEVSSHLQTCGQDLRSLSYLGSIQRRARGQMEADLEAHYRSKEYLRPASLAVLDEEGRVCYATGTAAEWNNEVRNEVLSWSRRRESRGKVYVVPWTKLAPATGSPISACRVMLATPLYRTDPTSSASSPVRSWTGALTMIVELGPTLSAHFGEMTTLSQSHRVWIMDRDGTILLQSEHPEMAHENIHRVRGECAQCHLSFDYAREMLVRGSGIAQYELKGQPRKLAAFAPMRFANASWTVVVNTPYAEVTSFVHRSYAQMLLLLGLITGAVGLASVQLRRCNLRRVRAEAEARQWQEKHHLEEQLRRIEERYHTLFRQSPNGILMLDPATTLPLEFNEAAHRQLGFAREEFARLRLADYMVNESADSIRGRLERIANQGRDVFETQHRCKEGEIRSVEVIAQTLELGAQKVVHCIYHDITERKRAELALAEQTEAIRREAAAKTMLLHDVNHRVKNNLVRLAEIVRLERELVPLTEGGQRAVLSDLESRLHGMEVVHSMLSSSQWRPLPLGELTNRIVSAALSNSPIRRQIQVTVVAPTDPLWVVPEQATALSLILNELATNSAKHAFRSRQDGHIQVRLTREDLGNGGRQVRLDYQDDGPGWPEPVLNGHLSRVGLRLIQASVRSPLRGQLSLRNDGGAAAALTFNLAASD